MVTSGSFTGWMGRAGEGAGVKGAMRPAKGRRTLDTGPLTSIRVSMNDPEVTMSKAVTNTNLAAHEKALETFDQVRAMTWRLLNPI